MAEGKSRPTVRVGTPVGGWQYPWANVAEIARVLPVERWTLIGGLMTQLHAIHRRIDAVRPTNDVDIVLHIEMFRGIPNATAAALESIGYTLKAHIDARNNMAHRFTRGNTHVDLVGDVDAVDVVIADHAAPSVEERMRRWEMVKVPGGTQALRRTVNYQVELEPGVTTAISVPRPFGALMLKAAAYTADLRDSDRHLFDAGARTRRDAQCLASHAGTVSATGPGCVARAVFYRLNRPNGPGIVRPRTRLIGCASCCSSSSPSW